MNKPNRSALITMVLLNMVCISHAGPKYIPVVSGLFTTGQWYFEGEKSSLGGNAALTFAPALQYSNRFSVIPTFQTNYRGTRSAEELAGGNTLFQDTWENGASVKAVHGLNQNWNLRETAGFSSKMFRETTDEKWSQGLYDYRIYTVGAELERHWNKKASIALGYDFSYLQFPNYNSLESSQSTDNSREFAGDNVLDNRMQLLSTRVKVPLPFKMNSNIQAFYSPREYLDQSVVELSGLLTETKREDEFVGSSLALERVSTPIRRTKLITSVQFGYSSMDSNQNHYDANQTAFIADYYDYDQHSIGGQLTFAFGNKAGAPMLVETGYTYAQRNYRSRVIQNAEGVYMNEKLYQIDQAINLAFSYPISRNFRLRMSTNFGQSKSNNDYESVYRYNYHNAEYQFGFTYDY